MATYLVTGGAGFIGSNIVHELVRQQDTVRVIDNLSTGRQTNLEAIEAQIELIQGDLTNPDTCQQVVNGVDYVLHQAAIPSVQRSIENPLKSHNSISNATLNLLNAARDAGVKRFVFASSSSIYGDSPTMPKQEDMTPRPKSPYAVAKLSAEQYCQVFSQVYGVETVSLRYFNVFGPRQDPTSQYSAVIPLFIKLMLAGKSPTIHGDGLQSRDFTYVSNNISANILAATTPNIGGQVFNIACGQRYNLLDLVGCINEILGTTIEPIFTTARSGDVKHSLADISKAKKYFNYHVEVDFRAGLARTIEWYRQHGQ